jgi:hypothetical protein
MRLIIITRSNSLFKDAGVDGNRRLEFLHTQPAHSELCQELAPIDYVWGAGYTMEDTK